MDSLLFCLHCCQWILSTQNCCEQGQNALFLETRCYLMPCNEPGIAIAYLKSQCPHSLTYRTTRSELVFRECAEHAVMSALSFASLSKQYTSYYF